MIFKSAYTKEEPIVITALEDSYGRAKQCFAGSRTDFSGWPEDTVGFLQSEVVGIETVKKAADILYGTNTFRFVGTSHLDELQSHDHYKPEINLLHHIRNVKLEIEYVSPYEDVYGGLGEPRQKRILDNAAFRRTQNRSKVRQELEAMFGLIDSAQSRPVSLEIFVHRSEKGVWEPRDSAPHLLELKCNKIPSQYIRFSRPLDAAPRNELCSCQRIRS